MCLILVNYANHPRYQLIVTANRDEFYERPTDQAAYWADHPDILAGRDREAGGTWLGVSRRGRFSAVTNFRDPMYHAEGKLSRGALVSGFLSGNESPREYLHRYGKTGPDYNGYNLLAGNLEHLYYLSNHEGLVRELTPGFHGLSNALLNSSWPKILRSQALLEKIYKNDTINPADLFDVMTDSVRPSDRELPDTGIGLEWERYLAPVFIQGEKYGTRCTSVVLMEKNGDCLFMERTYDNEKKMTGEVEESFTIE